MRTGKFSWGFLDYVVVLAGFVITVFGVFLTMPWLALAGVVVLAAGICLWVAGRRRV